MLREAFDSGITHFDLANNYGPPAGSAEENFGLLLKKDFMGHRDEMIISSKAGYHMWDGPYGEWGSRKYLISSCDQSLKRMGLDYVDIFYSHRPDPNTPLEETMGALDSLVRQGKALYVGLSNYDPIQTQKAIEILNKLGTPCLIHQPKYSMLVRDPENGLLDVLEKNGVGCIPFSPLAQGLLTGKYLGGIPSDSRAAKDSGFLQKDEVTPEVIGKIQSLNELAQKRGQTLAQMALAWLLKNPVITSVLVGASSVSQLKDSLKSTQNTQFDDAEINKIEEILN
ncbi:MAG: L-glyceraldehyde 3-phosphate reductase [Flavobacteriaceae bacterium]|nr:MAG: L-glyceraldehyde 3-phosphate reductase [Flavobacteriaceae bacterium]